MNFCKLLFASDERELSLRVLELFQWRPQSGLSKTYVKKTEADRLTAEVLRSCRAMIGAKLDDWNVVLSQQAKSRDQAEQVRCYADSELRQSFDDLRHEFQVIFVLLLSCSLKTRMWANAQRDGRSAEYRWRPLFNAAKFG